MTGVEGPSKYVFFSCIDLHKHVRPGSPVFYQALCL